MSANKIKSRVIPRGDFQRIVKSVSQHSSKDRIGRLIYKSSLKDSVNKCVYNEANKECAPGKICPCQETTVVKMLLHFQQAL